ncbi:hypothetical protein [Micromonospora costi]|uniref:hypothetical protein n=1 Tax=Micromonospora costi TaxID=1530042 RepID=UPI001319EABA|nr:hypothetical protein [Micromonospora costi]
MTRIEYDEMDDEFYYICHEPKCPRRTGKGWMRWNAANRDADYHEQQHADGVI